MKNTANAKPIRNIRSVTLNAAARLPNEALLPPVCACMLTCSDLQRERDPFASSHRRGDGLRRLERTRVGKAVSVGHGLTTSFSFPIQSWTHQARSTADDREWRNVRTSVLKPVPAASRTR